MPGPFATAYLDSDRANENGAKDVELRWQSLREDLSSAGADEDTLAAMDEVAGSHLDLPGSHGQLIVGTQGTVVLDRILARPPLRATARWSPLPHVMPFFAQGGPQIAHVLVVADRTGADLSTVGLNDALAAVPGQKLTVTGNEQHPLHKVGRDQWNERQFQNRVDNAWAANAHDVSAEVLKQVNNARARLVIVAGEERARALLRQSLPEVLAPAVAVEEVTAGGRAAGASEEALEEAVHGVLLRHLWRERRQLLERLQQEVGRHDYGVLGLTAVLDALRRAQVDTLVLSDDPSSTAMAWVGPEPLQLGETEDELRAMGVADPQRDHLDAAIVRALAGSAAQILVTPDAHDYLPDGLGAVLRYTDASTPA